MAGAADTGAMIILWGMLWRRYLLTPYLLLLLLAGVLVVCSFVVHGGLAVHGHDTYVAMGNAGLYRIWATVLLGIWVVYVVGDKVLPSLRLAQLHIYSLVLFGGVWLLFDFTGWPRAAPPARARTYYDAAPKVLSNGYDVLYLALTLVLLLGGVCFVVNLTRGIVKWLRRG